MESGNRVAGERRAIQDKSARDRVKRKAETFMIVKEHDGPKENSLPDAVRKYHSGGEDEFWKEGDETGKGRMMCMLKDRRRRGDTVT
jgi:hypothetical protein